MGVIRRVLSFAVVVLGLTFLCVSIWTFLWPQRPLAEVAPAQAILCYGAGVDADGRIDAATAQRTRVCAQLFVAGKAPLVVMSSGAAASGDIPGAEAMAALAISLGVSDTAIVLEPNAQSTLQNALFSKSLLPEADNVIVVTEAFHLPRAWVSTRWAGFETAALVPSESIRPGSWADRSVMLVRETLAIWFNLLRTAAYVIGGWVGVERETRTVWLT